jgi:hypothetical protein
MDLDCIITVDSFVLGGRSRELYISTTHCLFGQHGVKCSSDLLPRSSQSEITWHSGNPHILVHPISSLLRTSGKEWVFLNAWPIRDVIFGTRRDSSDFHVILTADFCGHAVEVGTLCREKKCKEAEI